MIPATPSATRPTRLALHLFLLLAALCAFAGAAAAAGPWEGDWDTRWPGGGARLRLEQTGKQVTGAYPLYNGTIRGTVDGRRLVGTWRTPTGSGRFVFVLSENGKSFMGRFGQDVWWTGSRISETVPDTGAEISQASPADTLHAFMVINEAVNNGELQYQDNAIGLLDFGRAGLAKRDELREATLLALVLDQFQFQLDDIRQRTPQDDRFVLPLTRYDGEKFELAFARRDNRWFIEAPPLAELEATLSRMLKDIGGRVPPTNNIFKMETPRDTMEAFIDSMRVGPGGLDTAVATLDLSELSPVGREREAVLIAQYLEQVLARIGEIVLQEIPNDPKSRTPYIHFTHPKGDIVIAPVETDKGVQWKFTPDTLRTIRQLFTATEDMPPAPRVLPLYRPDMAVFFQIRSLLGDVFPAALSPLGPLEIWQWVAMAAAFVIALVGAALVSLLLVLVGRSKESDEENGKESGVSSGRLAFWGVCLLAFGAISYAGLGLLGLPDSFASVVLAVSLVAVIAGAIPIEFWIVDTMRGWLARAGVITERGEILASLLVGVIKVAIVVGNLLLLAEALKIPYGAALAGLGIGGLAVALAARSTLENVIAGFIMFADKTVSVGDFFRFGDRFGTVERIGIRSTAVRTLDRTLVAVPNSDLVTSHLENYTHRDRSFLRKRFRLRYDTSPDQLRYVLAETRRMLLAHPKIAEDPARVRLVDFGKDALEIEIFAYVETVDWAAYFAIAEDVFLRLMEIVDRSGTAFAVPTRTLHVGRDTGRDASRAETAEAAVADWRSETRLPFPNFTVSEVDGFRNSLSYPPEGAPPIVEQESCGQPRAGRARGRLWAMMAGRRFARQG